MPVIEIEYTEDELRDLWRRISVSGTPLYFCVIAFCCIPSLVAGGWLWLWTIIALLLVCPVTYRSRKAREARFLRGVLNSPRGFQ